MRTLFIVIVINLSSYFTAYVFSAEIKPLAVEQQSSSEIKIQTSAVCEMCKKTIEEGLIFEKGIKSVSLDLENFVLTVVYNPKKTNPDEIRNKVSGLGYHADEVKADEKAFNNLHSCCKKPH